MNRFIVLDTLRHRRLNLFIVGCLYLFALIPMADLIWGEVNHAIGALVLGIAAMFMWVGFGPNSEPLPVALRLNAQLPISRTNLISTQWLMRTVFPAAFLAVLFAVAGPLGMTEHTLSALPGWLPLHIFFAYLGGLSLVFLAGTLGNHPVQMPALYLGVSIPMGYLLWLPSLPEAAQLAPMLLAAVLAAATYWVAHVRLATGRAVTRVMEKVSSTRRPLNELLPSGFARLAASNFAYSLTYGVAIVGTVVLFSWWSNPSKIDGTDEVFTSSSTLTGLATLCLVLYFKFINDVSLNFPIRVLRSLPLTVDKLALRILAITVGTQMLVLAILTSASAALVGFGSGLLMLDACLVLTATLSPIVPTALWIQGARRLGAIAIFLCAVYASVGLFSSPFIDKSTSGLLIANLIALAILLASWWLTKRALVRSSGAYRAGFNQAEGAVRQN